MSKGRLEAFSDGVIAISVTIMVLELRPPEAATLEALRPLVPVSGMRGCFAAKRVTRSIQVTPSLRCSYVPGCARGLPIWARLLRFAQR